MCRRTRLLAAGLALLGCGKRARHPEDEIARDLATQLGAKAVKVQCAAGAAPKRCTADVDGASLPITLAANGDWTLDGMVIATRDLIGQIGEQLDDVGVAATIDCGPAFRVVQVGERLQCGLDVGGQAGAAFVRILDDDGHVDVELALDPASVAARNARADEAALEAQSRALENAPETLDEEGDDSDAGAPP